ncbi:MAG: DUF3179 domain-containing (seleno)protein [Salinirussus sp.]
MVSHARDTADESRLTALLDRLLVKDVDEHAAALSELAGVGDERVVPHLVELCYLDTVANDWAKFGFPEIFRRKHPPRPLTHPEVRWPGVVETLRAVADPDYDDPETAWLRWETWYTQQEIEPLEGFMDWKVRLYRSYHPLVGQMLDVSPTVEDFHEIRWGSCDRSTLHPLNGPDFVSAAEADYLREDDLVYAFEVAGQAFAVPRFVLFPHEMLNAELAGRPLCLSLCTMCNSPILYDRRVEGHAPEFGSTGLVWRGNKAMYDERTHSLWNQQTGEPIAGEMYVADASLDFLPVTQTDWETWLADNPETAVLAPDTSYDYDYDYYRDYDGFIKRHYWENGGAIHPGVRAVDGILDGKTYVYGVETDDGLRVYPAESVRANEPVVDDGGDRTLVAVVVAGDIAVYEAPSLPVERDGDALVGADGSRWVIATDGLHGDGGTLDRVPGRHGLWLSFRPHYDEYTVVEEQSRNA